MVRVIFSLLSWWKRFQREFNTRYGWFFTNGMKQPFYWRKGNVRNMNKARS